MTATQPAAGAAADFEMVVGLEVHVQLKTRTKAFCNCSTDFGAAPNVNTCPVCLALPGALPVLNRRAVELAVRAAIALKCTVHPVSIFARKNYFYPDLPKGYQISQYDRPLATAGQLQIGADERGAPVKVGITRLHMEEDAGKSIHDRYRRASAIDLNRSGVPLIEIVSEPDMRSAEEAGAYLRAIKQVLEYADVSDVSMEEGSLRVDANVSARPRGETKLGTKTEVKNMNSFSGVERALRAEFARQCAVLARGGTVEQQTMLWDGHRGEVRPARSKEGSHDYRYFPEPDLPPLVLTPKWIMEIGEGLGELPPDKKERFRKEYGLPDRDIEVLTMSPHTADYFESTARAHADPKTAANWVMGPVAEALNATGEDIRTFRVRPRDLAKLLDMVRAGVVTRDAGKEIFLGMLESGEEPEQVAERLGKARVEDDAKIIEWIDEAFSERPQEALRYQNGERKLQGIFVGAVMKKSKGNADARKVNQLLAARVKG
ncbi:MAG: Asp-tRNA(Asn)/Glu-tRNA(Gln) amidotransferase subunit GatB [Gemmatimonadaceae bacterium]